MRYTPDNITELQADEIFVFGSNLDGRHGKGAALTAKQKFGAVQGIASGKMGQSYALPTVWHNLQRMSLKEIDWHVKGFLKYAAAWPELTFLVTQIGCGLAGHKVSNIAPMFKVRSENVILPQVFHQNL